MLCCARRLLLLSLFLMIGLSASAQDPADKTQDALAKDSPVANPGRPTVSTPATLTPIGYLQFETGTLGARTSPDLVSQVFIDEVIKYSISRWIELLTGANPYVHSHALGQPTNGAGDVTVGIQGVVHPGEGAN